jgi:hypothetical protein
VGLIADVKSINIYCCYNIQDRAVWETFEQHFAVLRRSGQVIFFDCYSISPGSDRTQEQYAGLVAADIVLLLLSHHFVADDLCWEIMLQAMQKYRAGEVWVVPIRLSPVYYESAPFAELAMLPKMKPITLWRNPHEAYKNVVDGICEIIIALQKNVTNGNNPLNNHESISLINEQGKQLTEKASETTSPVDSDQEGFEK